MHDVNNRWVLATVATDLLAVIVEFYKCTLFFFPIILGHHPWRLDIFVNREHPCIPGCEF